METDTFWSALQELVDGAKLVIDRPRGSSHPRYPTFVMPLDYGYLAGTGAMDGGGVDIWVGSGDRQWVSGAVCTVDLVKRDTELKILLGCSPAEMKRIEETHNSGPQRAILMVRPGERAER